jgi:CMP-N-acetylneuraminate monooxygenase
MILNNLKEIGFFLENQIDFQIEIPINTLKKGLNDINNFIIKVLDDNSIDYIIDKVCDHAGGKMILKGNELVCPLHGWKLNTKDLMYNSSYIKKQVVDFQINESSIFINDFKKTIENPYKKAKDGCAKIYWLNHATVLIECNGKTLITDPWLFGPAFLTGWWLQNPSPKPSIEHIKNADYIYISHNHPDHLHPETLFLVGKDTKIIIPDFESKSVQKYLEYLGFSNIYPCRFNYIYELEKDFQFSIFKSGDFRDDSGIYLNLNGHEVLMTVDSNFLNSHKLPTNIDLLMTSFAGGASGFPLCYPAYDDDNKREILERNKHAIMFSVHQYIKMTTPTYYMPYAGMFSEKASRDIYIKENNHKNTISNYSRITKKEKVTLIETMNDQVLIFDNGTLNIEKLSDMTYLEIENFDFYIDKLKKDNPINKDYILNYFKSSNFKGNQILQIFLCNDNFDNSLDYYFFIDFSNEIFETRMISNIINYNGFTRLMNLSVRAEIFMAVVNNKLPWEDFSIGFQMRVERFPNEYESEFWYHFTNNYIGDMNYRYNSHCGSCNKINQNPIFNKSNAR